MAHEMADWVHRVGLLLGFLSFWFAAPEFIGETRLLNWEEIVARGIGKLPFAVKALTVLIMASSGWYYIVLSIENGRMEPMSGTSLLMGGVLGATIVFFDSIKPYLDKIVSRVAKDEHIRQRSLLLGGVLFTLSFVLEFIATFQKSSP